MSRQFLFAVFLLCAIAGCATPIDERPAASLSVNPRIRTQLDRFAGASDKQAKAMAVSQLRFAYGNDPSAFVAQLVLYDLAHAQDAASPTVMSQVIQQVPVSSDDLFYAAVPLLTTQDPALHGRLIDLVASVGPDKSRAYLKAHPMDNGNGVPEVLLRNDPSALSFLADTYSVSVAERRRIDRADTILHVAERSAATDPIVADAQTRADDISHSPRWWVRFYVAMQLGSPTKVINDDTANRLTTDTDFRVRLMAQQRMKK